MKIQSAGRLGNILFIWAYALNHAINGKHNNVEIFADKYHTSIDESLIDTFQKLSSKEVKLKVDNKSGLILKALDKITQFMPNQSRVIRRKFRIQSEDLDSISDNAWIQRGYFQNAMYFEDCQEEIHRRLIEIIRDTVVTAQLMVRFPFLVYEYQAIHVRLSDFIGSEAGVIDLKSQIKCLDKNLKTVICTDGTKSEILSMISLQDFEIITPDESTAWETIAILSGAKVFISSNSTLSWWSGFIAAGNGAKVWIPKIWNKTLLSPKPLPFSHVLTYIPNFV